MVEGLLERCSPFTPPHELMAVVTKDIWAVTGVYVAIVVAIMAWIYTKRFGPTLEGLAGRKLSGAWALFRAGLRFT